jgi:hypothetical protein
MGASRIGDPFAHRTIRRAAGGLLVADVVLHVLHAATGAGGRAVDTPVDQWLYVTRAAALHDVGKVAVPDEVLHKPGPLDEGEWRFLREHTIVGERILAAAPALAPVGRIVRSTHERWDGSG